MSSTSPSTRSSSPGRTDVARQLVEAGADDAVGGLEIAVHQATASLTSRRHDVLAGGVCWPRWHRMCRDEVQGCGAVSRTLCAPLSTS
jgi:hypothetical protein